MISNDVVLVDIRTEVHMQATHQCTHTNNFLLFLNILKQLFL